MTVFEAFNRQKACRHGQMLYNMHDLYIGRSLDLYGEYSEDEVELFRQIVHPGQAVVEVGANIGAHTLFLAQHVGPQGVVLAFEPQRMIFQVLCANMALNSIPNVFCSHAAVGARRGTVKVPSLDYTLPANYGGLSLGEDQFGEDVALVTLDGENLPRCDFLKIDVEGMEKDVIEGASKMIERHKPIMYVENNDRSADLIRRIDSLGYAMYWHNASYFKAGNFFSNPNNVFPNCASRNMFCVHRGVRHEAQGFAPVEVTPLVAPSS